MNGTTACDAEIPEPPRKPRRSQILWGVAILIVVAAGTAWYLSAWRYLFFYAIRSNSVTLARTMLKVGTDANASLGGESPLTVALESPSSLLATVQLLLDFHADPNRLDVNGKAAPLEKVHGPDASAIFDALLAAGANIKACSRNGSILHHAWPIPYAKFLLSRGADVNLVCETTGTTPLYEVVANPALVTLYLEEGAKIVPDAWHKITPLQRVASLWHDKSNSGDPSDLKSAEVLIAHGAEINAVDYNGRTALDYAYETGNKEIAALLLKHGAKSLKFKSAEEGEESHAGKDEYEDLLMFSENEGKGPRCSLSLTGENRNTMEEGSEWSIVKGTVGLVRVNCHASGYFHYAVLGMGPPAPKKLNMPLGGGPGASRITFNEKWSRGIMHWYYSESPVANLAKAVKQGKATQFATRYVTVGE